MNYKCPWCESENNTSFLKLKDYFLSQEDFEIYEDKELWYFVPEIKQSSVMWYIVSGLLKQ